MMLLRTRDNNIQSFAYTWLHKGNQNEFLKHPKINFLKYTFWLYDCYTDVQTRSYQSLKLTSIALKV